MPSPSSLTRAYTATALLLLNAIVAIVAANLVIGAAYFVADELGAGETTPPRVDRDAYSTLTPREVTEFLEEQSEGQDTGYNYRPWVQFRAEPRKGKFINTDDRGFRVTPRVPRPGATPLVVAVYGGSTTFGYGVPDQYTIPAALGAVLTERWIDRDIDVRNFGQEDYYSSQELTSFVLRLKQGPTPDWAVFIDGINDVLNVDERGEQDEPPFTGLFRWLGNLYATDRLVSWETLSRSGRFRAIPMVRLASQLRRGSEAEETPPWEDRRAVADSARVAEFVVRRYAANRRIMRTLCAANGIRCLFVWQPSPFVDYDPSLHAVSPYDGAIPPIWREAYGLMKRDDAPDLLYLGAMLSDVHEKVFVDDVHYNEKWNRRVAEAIADRIIGAAGATPAPTASRTSSRHTARSSPR